MIERCVRFAGAFLVMTQAAYFVACSSSDTPSTSTGGSGSSTGGTSSTGGSGSSTGGTSSTGGSGSSTGGGSSTAMCKDTWPNPYNTDAQCKGITTGGGCTVADKACPDLVCGLADSGRRSCTCTGGVWNCTACDYSMSGFKTKPNPLVACTGAEFDKVPCTTECSVCANATEVCACAYDDEQAMIWDCDKPPTSW